MTTLAELTTLRLGGPAQSLIRVSSEDELIEIEEAEDDAGEAVLIVGGGSNLVVADDGFPGAVVKIETSGVRADVDDCSGATVTVAAGESWDDLVARAVTEGWSGIETLSGIPGSVGAVPIQNVGAYGEEVSTIDRPRPGLGPR